jgi:cysteinyl-tRNA synthetase
MEKHQVVKYWMHNNMITISGQKMARSLGNFITLEQLFAGEHELLEKAYNPMTVRFFILQAHYRSTVDFSNEALLAAEKSLERLFDAYARIDKVPASPASSADVKGIRSKCYDALNDDLNSAIVIAQLYDAATTINSANAGNITLNQEDINELKDIFDIFLFGILGIRNEATSSNNNNEAFGKAMDLLLDIRQKAKDNKDWTTSDQIRNELTKAGFDIKDGKDGAEWKLK